MTAVFSKLGVPIATHKTDGFLVDNQAFQLRLPDMTNWLAWRSSSMIGEGCALAHGTRWNLC